MRAAALIVLFLASACGARSGLPGTEAGGNAASQGGGGGEGPMDPDVECPITCTAEACLPVILADDTPTGWHAIDGATLYYTTSIPEGGNGLFRTSICDGQTELLLARDQFSGWGALIGDDVFVTSAAPTVEVLRLPKSGGEPSVYYADPTSVSRTFGFVEVGEHLLLVRYHFDGGYGLDELTNEGTLATWIESVPDPDWQLWDAGFGFSPNVPLADSDEFGTLWAGSELGVFTAGGPGLIGKASDTPVRGRLLGELRDGGGESIFFTGIGADGFEHQYELSAYYSPEPVTPTEILPGQPGLMLAVDEGELFGASEYASENIAVVWHGRPDGTPRGIMQSDQRVADIVAGKQSLYARTERRIVRVPKACPGDDAAPCIVLD